MPRKPTPWFPIYAAELLTDEKIEELSHDELGILLRLWSKMWINGTERGTLLREPGVPISDEKIADFLHLSVDQWAKMESRLVSQVKVLKRGENMELFSSRLRNFKTKWELYGPEKESKKKRKRKITEKYLTTESSSSSESESEKKNTLSDPRVRRLFDFFCVVFFNTFPNKKYRATFGRDQKIIKDQLAYADKAYDHPELALAVTMDQWLDKQKGSGDFKKTTIPGWLKDFNTVNVDIDWETIDWEEVQKGYGLAQKEAEKRREAK